MGEELSNISVLCDSWGSSLVSLNLSLLVRISSIPDGQSSGYSETLGPGATFVLSVLTHCGASYLPAVPITSSVLAVLDPA